MSSPEESSLMQNGGGDDDVENAGDQCCAAQRDDWNSCDPSYHATGISIITWILGAAWAIQFIFGVMTIFGSGPITTKDYAIMSYCYIAVSFAALVLIWVFAGIRMPYTGLKNPAKAAYMPPIIFSISFLLTQVIFVIAVVNFNWRYSHSDLESFNDTPASSFLTTTTGVAMMNAWYARFNLIMIFSVVSFLAFLNVIAKQMHKDGIAPEELTKAIRAVKHTAALRANQATTNVART